MRIIRRTNDFFPNAFDNFLNDFGTTKHLVNNPAVNVKETEEGFQVQIAAPGLKKEDFKVEINKNLLTISSAKKAEEESKENGKFTRREFSYQSFSRSFTLSQSIDTEKIEAKYEQGILNITLPKREEAKVKPARTVEIV